MSHTSCNTLPYSLCSLGSILLPHSFWLSLFPWNPSNNPSPLLFNFLLVPSLHYPLRNLSLPLFLHPQYIVLYIWIFLLVSSNLGIFLPYVGFIYLSSKTFLQFHHNYLSGFIFFHGLFTKASTPHHPPSFFLGVQSWSWMCFFPFIIDYSLNSMISYFPLSFHFSLLLSSWFLTHFPQIFFYLSNSLVWIHLENVSLISWGFFLYSSIFCLWTSQRSP